MEVTWNDGYNAPFVGNIEVDPVSGSATTGYCDYQYYSATAGRVLWRSGRNSSTNDGVACSNAYYDPSYTNTFVGSRLAYRGKITEISDIEQFKSLVEV